MDEHVEHTANGERADTGQAVGPDPHLSPLHEGQLSLMPQDESRNRDYAPESDTGAWSPVDRPGSHAEEVMAGPDGLAETNDLEPRMSEVDGAPAEQPLAEAPDCQAATHLDETPPVDAPETGEDVVMPSEEEASELGQPDLSVESEAMPSQSNSMDDAGSWPGLSVPSAGGSAYDLPTLERERPHRDPLVPRWVYVAVGAVCAAIALAAAGFFWYLSASTIAVPDVTGVELSVATTRLEDAGLRIRVTDRRFSDEPRDEVLVQTPAPGSELRRGDTVEVVVSAGTEDIVMPDVVGQGLMLARSQLEERGLVIEIVATPSDVPSDTVLGTTPSPGAIVRTGDRVTLQVASPVNGSNGLSPYDMQGLGIVLDAAPTGTQSDTTMEVARRLRSLLEASGASVTMLRSATTTNVPESVRAQAASTATGTIGIGLSIAPDAAAGRHVSIPVTGTPDALQRSQLLASSIASQLAGIAPPVTSSTSSTETVLQASRLPWARIVLGSATAREDQTRFADPSWADQMARAIYTALGQLYGVRE